MPLLLPLLHFLRPSPQLFLLLSLLLSVLLSLLLSRLPSVA
jgi:hypothetical protein